MQIKGHKRGGAAASAARAHGAAQTKACPPCSTRASPRSHLTAARSKTARAMTCTIKTSCWSRSIRRNTSSRHSKALTYASGNTSTEDTRRPSRGSKPSACRSWLSAVAGYRYHVSLRNLKTSLWPPQNALRRIGIRKWRSGSNLKHSRTNSRRIVRSLSARRPHWRKLRPNYATSPRNRRTL